MKKALYLLLFICSFTFPSRAQYILSSKNATVSFFSGTVMEDIEGKSNTASSVIDPKTRNIIFKVSNTSFQFQKKLMQEHFNEDYMESDRYPFSKFSGRITDELDFNKDGNYNLTVEGTLQIHGVTKPWSCRVAMIISNGVVTAKSVFKIKIEDYQIKIPSLVFKNIAEYVEVRLSAVYQPTKTITK